MFPGINLFFGKLGYNLLAKKHSVKSHKQISNWMKIYEEFGTEGIIKKKL